MNLQSPLLAAATAVLILAGCSPERRTVEIDQTRTVNAPAPRLGASSQQRFGGPMSSAAQQPPASPFVYDLPRGWQELPTQQFRDVNLSAPGGVKAWVTLMGPGAGGALGNLTRWRGQLGLSPATAEELGGLAEFPLLGGTGQQVDLTSADGSSRLVAVMLFAPDRSVFVRMSGPVDAVGEQLPAFAAFRDSLADAGAAAASSGGASAGDASAAAGAAGDFGWTTPAGWLPGGSSQFKLIEFEVGDAKCWLSELAGDGGGFAGNVERWCRQAGRPPMSAAELDGLPRLPVLGTSAPFVALLGDGDEDGLFGVVVPLENRTLFVKMSGPSDQLRAHRAEFEAFCRSLTVKG